ASGLRMANQPKVSPMNGAGGRSCMWNAEPAINRGSKRWKPRERGSGSCVADGTPQRSFPTAHRVGVAMIALAGINGLLVAYAAEPGAVAFPVAETSFPAQLAGIDREWNISFRAAGKVRVMGAGELAYWGRWRDVEAG